MGLFNTFHVSMKCPRCGNISEFEIECNFGYRNQFDFKIGDKIKWLQGKSVQNGGRPIDGNMTGEGYAECFICKKDFFVDVIIEKDIIKRVEVNTVKKGYIKDG